MPSFKEMDQDAIRALLDATNEKGEKLYQDVLTPLVQHEQELFASSPCPKCGDYSGSPTLNTKRPFVRGSPLPNKILRCLACKTEYDPRTGLVHFATLIHEPG